MNTARRGNYGADDDIVDYILGITFEIWEEGGIELIHRYYADDVIVFGLDNVLRGAAVIWSGSRTEGYYSSHRVVSPMTNTGPSAFGPATNRNVTIMNIADCIVEEGVITGEWLMRDNGALVRQLGFDVADAARQIAAGRSDESREWIVRETERLRDAGLSALPDEPAAPALDAGMFAHHVIAALWSDGNGDVLERAYAPYAVLHRSPIERYSGRAAVMTHYASLRGALAPYGVSVDHVATQPYGIDGMHVAVRWAVAGRHEGDYLGCAASGKDVYVLGSSHFRIVADRIAVEWTVFDSAAVLSQMLE